MNSHALDLFGLKPDSVSEIIGVEDLQQHLESVKNPSEAVYFFTGKGTRNGIIHLGHHYIFETLRRLSNNFQVVMQISNDQKRNLGRAPQYYDQTLKITSEFKEYISKLNYNPNNLLLIENLDMDTYYIMCNIANMIGKNIKIRTILSSHGNLNTYQAFYLLLQMVPIILMAHQHPQKLCVIVTAQDQKGCFLLLRDIAHKLNVRRPVVIVLNPMLDLMLKEKMSSSNAKDCVSIHDLESIMRGISSDKLTKSQDFVEHVLHYYGSLYPSLTSIRDIGTRNTQKKKIRLISDLKEIFKAVFDTASYQIRSPEFIQKWKRSHKEGRIDLLSQLEKKFFKGQLGLNDRFY